MDQLRLLVQEPRKFRNKVGDALSARNKRGDFWAIECTNCGRFYVYRGPACFAVFAPEAPTAPPGSMLKLFGTADVAYEGILSFRPRYALSQFHLRGGLIASELRQEVGDPTVMDMAMILTYFYYLDDDRTLELRFADSGEGPLESALLRDWKTGGETPFWPTRQ
jgi:hypothetical protein